MTRPVLVEEAAIVTCDDRGTVHERGWLLSENERIVGVGAGEAPAAMRRSAERLDARGCAVMPGMTNGHTHLFQTFFRGLGDDKSLLDWLKEYIWPAASVMEPDELAAATSIGIIENLRTGATTIIDHQYLHPGGAHDDAACDTAERLGARYLLASGWADRNYEPRLTESADRVIERSVDIARRRHGSADDLIRIESAPLIPWGCSDSAMQSTTAASRGWGGGMHVHCAETAVEVDMNLHERGLRHVHWLDSLGLLGPDVQLAHSVWLDESEIEAVARSGAVVVHCPVSNMYLASGVAPIPALLRAGATVALASDGPGSNNRQDLFEAMKMSVLLQKVHHLDATVLLPEDALRMATRGGAHAAGRPSELGALETGRLADFVVVDLDSVFVAPVHRVVSALVFNVTPREVRHVVVNGRVVIRDRRLESADERAELRSAWHACRALFRRAGLAVPPRLD